MRKVIITTEQKKIHNKPNTLDIGDSFLRNIFDAVVNE